MISIDHMFAGVFAGVLAVTACPAAAYDEFRCDIDSYEGSGTHLQKLKLADNYEGFFGLMMQGSEEAHQRMRSAAAQLELDLGRTPIIYGDMETGDLHVTYCPNMTCTRHDVARQLEDCARALESRSCLPFAIRVDTTLLCVAGPRPTAP